MPIEPFSGGLVNAGDPSLLKEGELQLTNDCTYRPQDLALWSAPGRTLYGNGIVATANATSGAMESTPGAFVNPLGLQYCGFDGKDKNDVAYPDVLLAQTSTYLATAIASESGSWTALELQSAIQPIQAVNYANRFFLFDGTNRNVLLKTRSLRHHGMAAVTTLPDLLQTVSTTGGLWIDDTIANSSGYYEYWTTELYIDKTNENDETVEGTFDASNVNLNFVVTSDIMGKGQIYIPKDDGVNETLHTFVTIYRPAQVNTNATHWNIYRSVKKTERKIGGFPTGLLVNNEPIPIATLSYIDGGGQWTSTGAATTSWAYATTTGPLNTFTDPDHAYGAPQLTADPAALATYVLPPTPSAMGVLHLSGFGLTGLNTPIGEIEVALWAAADFETARYNIEIGDDNGVGGSIGSGYLTGNTEPAIIVSGLGTLSWSSETIASLYVAVSVQQIGHIHNTNFAIDSVGVRVFSGGGGDVVTTVFPAVNIEEFGAVVGKGRNGRPPIATTGDILQDRLLLNDVNDSKIVRYSTPGQPDYFAEPYWLPCDTKDKDIVTCIKTLGNVAVVGLENKLFRVMFLPSETDGVFERGDALECFSMERGIANARAACTFQLEGQPLMLACVDSQGIYMTDGYKVYTLTDDIDWTSMVDVTELDTCELVCNPTEFKLVLYYNPVST